MKATEIDATGNEVDDLGRRRWKVSKFESVESVQLLFDVLLQQQKLHVLPQEYHLRQATGVAKVFGLCVQNKTESEAKQTRIVMKVETSQYLSYII